MKFEENELSHVGQLRLEALTAGYPPDLVKLAEPFLRRGLKLLEDLKLPGIGESTKSDELLEGPFITPARLLELLNRAVDGDPGTERKLMLFYLDEDHEQSLDLVEVYSEARICSMTFRRRE